MDSIKQFGHTTFSSLRIRNYRLYFAGQSISQIGQWMQIVALGWLVLELTGSGLALGTILGLRFTPIFFGGLFAGIVVERFNKRRILFVTQVVFGLISLALALLVYSDTIQVWMLYVLTLVGGCADLFDRPTRQTFVHAMVGHENLRNAVSLNSTNINLARAIGPLIAGALIAGIGIATCFLITALSSIAIFITLYLIREEELYTEERGVPPKELLAGVRYAASVPKIRDILIVMGIVGTLSYEFQVTLPLLAHGAFGGSAADYAALLSAMGAGSVAGGLFAASRKQLSLREYVLSVFFFGVSICAAALMPTLGLAIAGMVFVGFFSIYLTSTGNTMIQLESAPHMRGYVMSLWMTAMFGSTLIGAPIVGFIGEYVGARTALFAGGVAALVAAAYAARKMLAWEGFRIIPESVGVASEEVEASESGKI